jgi:hypothetical protein
MVWGVLTAIQLKRNNSFGLLGYSLVLGLLLLMTSDGFGQSTTVLKWNYGSSAFTLKSTTRHNNVIPADPIYFSGNTTAYGNGFRIQSTSQSNSNGNSGFYTQIQGIPQTETPSWFSVARTNVNPTLLGPTMWSRFTLGPNSSFSLSALALKFRYQRPSSSAANSARACLTWYDGAAFRRRYTSVASLSAGSSSSTWTTTTMSIAGSGSAGDALPTGTAMAGKTFLLELHFFGATSSTSHMRLDDVELLADSAVTGSIGWLTGATMTAGNVGRPYFLRLKAGSGNVASISYSRVSGTLPPGLSLVAGELFGTPTTAGTYTFTLRATGTTSSDRAFTLVIGAAVAAPTGANILAQFDFDADRDPDIFLPSSPLSPCIDEISYGFDDYDGISNSIHREGSSATADNPITPDGNGDGRTRCFLGWDVGNKYDPGRIDLRHIVDASSPSSDWHFDVFPSTNTSSIPPTSLSTNGESKTLQISMTFDNLSAGNLNSFSMDMVRWLKDNMADDGTLGPRYARLYAYYLNDANVLQQWTGSTIDIDAIYYPAPHKAGLNQFKNYWWNLATLDTAINATTKKYGGRKIAFEIYFYNEHGYDWQLVPVVLFDDITIKGTFTCACSTITIAPTSLIDATLNAAYSRTITATGGTGPYTFTRTAGTLPTGLSLSSSGVLSGTPTVVNGVGSTFTVRAVDSKGCSSSKTYVLQVCPTISLPLPTLTGSVGKAYSASFAASGGTAPYVYTLTGNPLPAGLNLNATTGTISGTPGEVTYQSVTVNATDANGCLSSRTYDFEIGCPAITVNPTALIDGVLGTAYSQTLSATGSAAPYEFYIWEGSLPNGLVLNNTTGAITGTPTKGTLGAGLLGFWNFDYNLTNFVTSSVSSTSIVDGDFDYFDYPSQLGTDGTSVYLFGDTLGAASYIEALVDVSETAFTTSFWFKTDDANAGLFSVKASELGTTGHDRHLYLTGGNLGVRLYNTEVLTTSGKNYADSVWHHIAYVYGGTEGGQKVYVDGVLVLSGAKANSDFTWQDRVCFGYSTDAVSKSMIGWIDEAAIWNIALTAEQVGFLASGVIRPAFGIGVYAYDQFGCSGNRYYMIDPDCPAMTINPANLPPAQVGRAYSYTMSATGGSGALRWSRTVGALPPGMALNATTGAITGTPTAAGTYSFTLRAVDARGCVGTRAVSFIVGCPVIDLYTSGLVLGRVGTSYSDQIDAVSLYGPVSTSGLVAQYQFTSDLIDRTMSGLNLTGSGGSFSGDGLQLASAAAYASVATSVLNTDTHSVAFYLRYTGDPNGVWSKIFGFRSGGSDRSPGIWREPSTNNMYWRYDPGDLGVSEPGFVKDRWYQITGVKNGASFTYYVNGAVAASATVPSPKSAGSAALEVGSAGGFSAPNSIIKDLRIYNRSLSAAEASVASTALTYSVTSGSLPAGLSLNAATGALSGTPSAGNGAGVSVTFTATDANGCADSRALIIKVCPVPVPGNLSTALVVGSAYSSSAAAIGGVAPYVYALTSGSLPTGLSLNTTTGAVTGTPSNSISTTFTISATDANSCAGTRTYTLSPACPAITITPATLARGTVGVAYNQTLTASGGTAPYSAWTVTAGTLPAGLTLNSSTGAITGTPTAFNAAGVSFTVRVNDSYGCQDTQVISLQICPVISISPTSLSAATIGTAYSQTVTATGGATPYSYTVSGGALPSWATLNASTGVISGTPSSTTNAVFIIRATDANGCTGTRSYSISPICPVINITPAALVNGTVGVAYNQTLAASGGTAPYSAWTVITGTLPAGLTLNSSTGAITGTPTASNAAGVSFTVRVNDTYGCQDTQVISLQICPVISLSPTSLGAATVGTAYSQTVTATGGATPYGYAVSSGALPAWATLNPTTGVITGTPNNTTTAVFTVRATDANDCIGTRAYTIAPACPSITITPAALTRGTVGVAYNQTFTATGGTAPYGTWTVTAGTLPAGLTLNSGTGAITGTPTAAASPATSITVRVSDTNGCQGTQVVSLQICPVITITPATPASGAVNIAYNQTLTATGGAGAYTWSVASGIFPPGLSLSTAGVVSGTPTDDISSVVTVRATDANGCVTTRALTFAMSCPPITVSPATLPLGTVGSAYTSTTFTATGGTAPYGNWVVTAGTLPAGLTLSTAGVLSGTPTTANGAGTSITVRTQDNFGCFGQSAYTLIICPVITVNPVSMPVSTVGTAYSQTITSTGGSGAVTYSVISGALPAWASLNGTTGVISGTPNSTTSASFTIRGTDINGCTGTRAYTITPVCPVITIAPAAPARGTVGIAYNQTLTASGGTGPYSAWTVTAGTLPAGLALNSSTGAITGTPTTSNAAGVSITVRVNDSYGCQDTQVISLQICPVISLSPTSLGAATVGTAYSQTVTATGGATPYSYAVSAGALPTWATLNASTGAITGTPSGTTNASFTIRATDANGCTGTRSYSISPICPVINITPAAVANGTVGVAYNQTLAASGGTGPYSAWTVIAGTLPAGLTLNSSTGAITGTPTASNAAGVSFTVRVNDTYGCQDTQVVSLQICPVISLSPTSLGAATVGTAYSQTVTATGGATPYGYAVSSGALPTWATLNASTGAITGTPNNTTTAVFTIRATDANDCTGTRAYTIAPACPTITITPATLTRGTVGVAYNQTLAVSGGTGPYSAWTVTAGTLPAGLALNSGTGVITGTPTTSNAAGVNITVRVNDSFGCQGTQVISLQICPVISLSPTSLSAATVGTAYSQSITATGGATPYTFALNSGSLPTWATLISSTGVLSGTPNSMTAATFTVRATDANGCVGVSQSYTITPLPNTDFGDWNGSNALTATTTSLVNSNLRLGAAIDAEANVTANATASVDDTTATDDEDGVSMPASILVGMSATIPVSVFNNNTAGRQLQAWIDFNNDGTFNNVDWTTAGGERIYNAVTPANAAQQTVNVTFTTPATASVGAQRGARFRLSDSATTTPTSSGATGEIEDYVVSINVGAILSLGNLVWIDNNNNGLRDTNDSGAPGVTVQLWTPGANGTEENGAGDDVKVGADKVTDINGNYLFNGLLAGTYYIRIPTPPVDFPLTSGVPDTADNQQDGDNNGRQPGGVGTAIRSPIITLTAGGEPAVGIDGDDTNGDLTIDFGLASTDPCYALNLIDNPSFEFNGGTNTTGALFAALGYNGTGTSFGTGVNSLRWVQGVNPTSTLNDPIQRMKVLAVGTGAKVGWLESARAHHGKRFMLLEGELSCVEVKPAGGGNWSSVLLPGNSYQFSVWADTASAANASFQLDLAASRAIFMVGNSATPLHFYTATQNRWLGSPASFASADYNGWNEATATSTQPNWKRYTYIINISATATAAQIDSASLILSAQPGSGPVAIDDIMICQPALSLGNLVWNDANNNGLKDTPESGLSGVTVQLFSPGSDNVIGGAVADIQVGASDITDVNGAYLFSSLSAGNYYVKVIPEAGEKTGGTPATTDNNVNNNNDGSQPGGIGTPLFSPIINLAPAAESTTDGDTNPNSNLTIDFGIYQCPAITVNPATLTYPIQNFAYSATITASGGTGAYNYTVTSGALPTGLALSSAGVLSGTVTSSTAANFTVTATDALGCSGSRGYTLSPVVTDFGDWNGSGAATTTTTSNRNTNLRLGLAVDAEASVTPNDAATADDTTNTGSADDEDGVTMPASITQRASVTIPVSVFNNNTANRVLQGWIDFNNNDIFDNNDVGAGGERIYNTAVPANAAQQTVNVTFTVPSGASPGTLRGVRFRFSDNAATTPISSGATGEIEDYTVTIACSTIAITPATLPDAYLGQAYSQTLIASNGTAPYTWTISSGTLPAGLSLSSGGIISGTPTSVTGSTFTVRVTDSFGCQATQAYTINGRGLAIGNLVFVDMNNDGIRQATESGAPGIAVQLWTPGVNGTRENAAGDDVQVGAATFTDSNGAYQFINLSPGVYYVRIQTPPTFFPSVSTLVVTTDNGVNNDNNGAQPGGSGTQVVSPLITLSAGGEPASGVDGDDTDRDSTIDFGFANTDPCYTNNLIDNPSFEFDGTANATGAAFTAMSYNGGGTSFGATNALTWLGGTNGSSGVGEPIQRVQVLAGNAGARVSWVESLKARHGRRYMLVQGTNSCVSLRAAGGGAWSSRLTAGKEYELSVWAANASAASANVIWDIAHVSGQVLQVISGPTPGSYQYYQVPQTEMTGTPSPFAAGNYNSWTEATGNATQPNWSRYTWRFRIMPTATTTQIDGLSLLLSGGPSTNPMVLDYVALCEVVPTNTMAIGSLVWNDLNRNGIKDAAESGVSGVTVDLYTSTNLIAGDGDDVLVATTTTSGSGIYSFANRAAGRYVVRVTPTVGLPLTGGSPVTLDNNIDNDNNGSQPGGSGTVLLSPVITLATGTESIIDGDTNPDTELTVDFGLWSGFSVGNLVWNDINNDGLYQSASEIGIGSVSVQLLNSGGSVVQTTTTNASGLYGFTVTTPGVYSVRIPTPPASFTLASSVAAADNGTDNDNNGTQTGGAGGVVNGPSFTLTAGGEPGTAGTTNIETTMDFGFRACATLTINPATLPNGTQYAAYNQTISATGGVSPYAYSITAGALPAGLTLNGTGVLSGTITGAPAVYSFTVRAADANVCVATRAYTLTVGCPSIAITPATLTNAVQLAAYSQTLTASGGTAAYTWNVSAGALPAGLTLSSAGTISGTTTAVPGVYNFTARAVDVNLCVGTLAYSLTVVCPAIAITPTSVAAATQYAAYTSQTFTATGGTAAYTWALSAGSLPDGHDP